MKKTGKKTNKKANKKKTYTAKIKKKFHIKDRELKLAIVILVILILLFIGATFAYFAITSVNNATPTTITGTGEELGTPMLTTNTTSLSLNLTANLMSQNNAHTRLYATPTGDAVIENALYPYDETVTTPVTIGNGRYKLATATLAGGDINMHCDYNFDVSATVTKEITDDSAKDIHVIVTSPKGETYRYRLDELLAGTKTINGVITDLSNTTPQEFTIESYAYNDGLNKQNDLSGNTYTIKVTPKSGTQGFSCKGAGTPKLEGFAKNLIDSGKLTQTGLEGDGYRFVGNNHEPYCEYHAGGDSEYYLKIEKNSDGTCPTKTLYQGNIVDSCPDGYEPSDFECGTISADDYSEMNIVSDTVNNNVCFGTTSKTECLNNKEKYMYQVIGVFADDYDNQHVKLIKSHPLNDRYAWHNNETDYSLWSDSDLNKGLNGSYFLNNTTYNYMQNNTWLNKIANWRWVSATDGEMLKPIYYENNNAEAIRKELTGITYFFSLPDDIFYHEMNKKEKITSLGKWIYNNAKIGIPYLSDVYLASNYKDSLLTVLEILNISSVEELKQELKKTADFSTAMTTSGILICSSWISLTEGNGTLANSLIEFGISDSLLNIYYYTLASFLPFLPAPPIVPFAITPTFYLESDVELSSGTGTLTDPYILK